MEFKKVLFLLSIISATPAIAQVGGNNTYEFLNLPISARVSALGGNLISVRDNDLNVSLINPSLLSDSMSNNIALSYINYFTDVNYGYVAYGKHIDKIGNFSAGIHYLDYGKFIRADEIGNTDGTFGASEMSFNLAYARSILDTNLSVGVTLKTIYSQLDSYTSWGSAIDLGATYVRPANGFTAAVVIKNMGRQWKPYVEGNKEKLPFEVQVGISKRPKHVPFRISLVYENLEKWDLTYIDPANPPLTEDPLTGEPIKQNKTKIWGDKFMRHLVVGGEFIITKNFFLRMGYNYQRRKELKIPEKRGASGFSFGFGFRVSKFHFSYGRAVYHLAGPSNNFSISCDLNSFYSKKVKSTVAP
ncbi:MAG: type IX secretion system protein PorQ [Bacteroidetes bacterium]|nr:type IX secretion system protein PorQ [Bacteroidota bacterium]